MKRVILSTPMMLEEGTFTMRQVPLCEAVRWVEAHNPTNYVGHSTVRVLGIEPATTRDVCDRYDQALSLKVQGRLDYGTEYSAEDIMALGVKAYLITRE